MITYQPLIDRLEEKHMKLRELMMQTGIAPNTMTRIRKNKPVTIEVLEKFCEVLKCNFGDVISYIPDSLRANVKGMQTKMNCEESDICQQ